MEDYKDVMLSEPPQRLGGRGANTSNATAGSTSGVGGGGGGGIDNYKGILLCDRPKDLRAARNASSQPFLPAGRTEDSQPGLPPSVEARIAREATHRPQTTTSRAAQTAFSKHRRWLSSFATAMKTMEADKVATIQAEAHKQQRIKAKADHDRNRVRSGETLQQAQQAFAARADGSNAATASNTATAGDAAAAAQGVSLPPIGSTRAGSGKAKAKGKKKKPLWAMTEDEAMDEEFKEATDLVNFAATLNFDKYMNDYEVKEAMAIMRERVQEIAAEQGVDLDAARDAARAAADEESVDDDDAVSTVSTTPSMADLAPEEKAMRKEARRAERRARRRAEEAGPVHPGWDASTSVVKKLRSAIDTDAVALAEKLLATNEQLRHVHSKQSLARVLQDVAIGEKAAEMPRPIAPVPPVVSTIPEGVVVSTPAEQPQKRVLTDLRKSKTHVQNLPYLYRCPSI